MAWLRWVAAALALADAGYMVVDGARALLTGDYFTPSTGEHAGQLGPWARVVESLGLDPRSTGMKLLFVVYGSVWLAVVAAFAPGRDWAWLAMLVLAGGSLWYLTIGTALSAAILGLLFVPAVRDVYGP